MRLQDNYNLSKNFSTQIERRFSRFIFVNSLITIHESNHLVRCVGTCLKYAKIDWTLIHSKDLSKDLELYISSFFSLIVKLYRMTICKLLSNRYGGNHTSHVIKLVHLENVQNILNFFTYNFYTICNPLPLCLRSEPCRIHPLSPP